jgi:hypothetical protein
LLLISGIPLLAATVAVTVIVTGTVAFAVASAAMMLVHEHHRGGQRAERLFYHLRFHVFSLFD